MHLINFFFITLNKLFHSSKLLIKRKKNLEKIAQRLGDATNRGNKLVAYEGKIWKSRQCCYDDHTADTDT